MVLVTLEQTLRAWERDPSATALRARVAHWPQRTLMTLLVSELHCSDQTRQFQSAVHALPREEVRLAVETSDAYGDTPLCLAVRGKKWSLALWLVDLGASVARAAPRDPSAAPLQLASAPLAPRALFAALCAARRREGPMTEGAACMHALAARATDARQRVALLELLLVDARANGLDVDACWHGTTALHRACKVGCRGVVSCLLRHGASSAAACCGPCALQVAAQVSPVCFAEMVRAQAHALRLREWGDAEVRAWVAALSRARTACVLQGALLCAFACIRAGRAATFEALRDAVGEHAPPEPLALARLVQTCSDPASAQSAGVLDELARELLVGKAGIAEFAIPKARAGAPASLLRFDGLCVLFYLFDVPHAALALDRIVDSTCSALSVCAAAHACAHLGLASHVAQLRDAFLLHSLRTPAAPHRVATWRWALERRWGGVGVVERARGSAAPLQARMRTVVQLMRAGVNSPLVALDSVSSAEAGAAPSTSEVSDPF